ncbi:pyridoxal phosphate-dependent transferase [Mycena rebaudengoi]|nr:pyridoxal phosphate-dependent transferase [Mycena rebaudengoi]
MGSKVISGPELPPAIPNLQALKHAEASLVQSLPDVGLGLESVQSHLVNDITPGFSGSSLSPNYYGVATGAVTEPALFADRLASTYDQNIQVHLPAETVATRVEDTALRLLQQLLSIKEDDFPGRLFTTGASAANVLALGVAREFVVAEAGRRQTPPTSTSVAELGIVEAYIQAQVQKLQILTTLPHSSLYKAASSVGIGRDSVVLLPLSDAQPWRFDMMALEQYLSNGAASIISVTAGEASTGRFAATREEMVKIRGLADAHGAWVHVDGAVGLAARILSHKSHDRLADAVSALQLADSITGDAHTFLNVPYDCGIFFTRHLQVQQTVFHNPGAVYLAKSESSIPSPLHIGLENSRRFRALPVYTSLLAYGRVWHRELLERQIALARRIAEYIVHSTVYELLPDNDVQSIYTVVLFQAHSESLNSQLVSLLNASRQMFIADVLWNGRQAARISVGTWRVDVDRDSRLVITALEGIVRDHVEA